jgi:hypothetical protein
MSAPDISVSGPCRDLRHAWETSTDIILIEEKGQVRHFARTLVCLRCHTERIDEYKISNVALSRVRTRYVYPKGYQIKGGIPVAEVRFQMFRHAQMIPKEDHDERVGFSGSVASG